MAVLNGGWCPQRISEIEKMPKIINWENISIWKQQDVVLRSFLRLVESEVNTIYCFYLLPHFFFLGLKHLSPWKGKPFYLICALSWLTACIFLDISMNLEIFGFQGDLSMSSHKPEGVGTIINTVIHIQRIKLEIQKTFLWILTVFNWFLNVYGD
jgi:hypothetical protein